jgi:hypothetical protein
MRSWYAEAIGWNVYSWVTEGTTHVHLAVVAART